MQRLRSAVDTQTSEESPKVNLHRMFADTQLFGYVAIAQTLIQHQDQLFLTLGELGGHGGCRVSGIGSFV